MFRSCIDCKGVGFLEKNTPSGVRRYITTSEKMPLPRYLDSQMFPHRSGEAATGWTSQGHVVQHTCQFQNWKLEGTA